MRAGDPACLAAADVFGRPPSRGPFPFLGGDIGITAHQECGQFAALLPGHRRVLGEDAAQVVLGTGRAELGTQGAYLLRGITALYRAGVLGSDKSPGAGHDGLRAWVIHTPSGGDCVATPGVR